MADKCGSAYEVIHTLGDVNVAEFDAWLGRHIEEMLAIPGVLRATGFVTDDDKAGRPRRVTLYQFKSDDELETYLAGPAKKMRQKISEVFPEGIDVTRRLLWQSTRVDDDIQPSEMCLNCGTTLAGQYCGNCGQRAHSRLISIWELVRDAFGDLLELDSRLWRTLIPLALRPGKITRDYLEGRRARCMPPFRTYLVLSIVFFLIAFFDPQEKFSLLLDTPEESAAEQAEANDSSDGLLPGWDNYDEAETESQAGPVDEDSPPPGPTDGKDDEDVNNGQSGFNIQIAGGETKPIDQCDDIANEDWPPWLAERLTPERMTVACKQVVADDGEAFIARLSDNVPAALIALLPLMALVLKMLYPASKRYYVEHVLFVVHFHAFIFLILSLHILFSQLVELVVAADTIWPITSTAVSLYIPIYFYKAIRRVYGQNWFVALLKYVVLLLAYGAGLIGILLVSAAFAAFAI